jgi:hypothetical protein
MSVVLLVLCAACGDAPLADLGGRSSGWIDEAKTTTTAPPATTPSNTADLVAVWEVGWWNIDLALKSFPTEAAVLSDVVERRTGSNRFIQASPFEVAAAIPGLEFPARLPGDVISITSQLVLAPDANRLDVDQVAAFGLWTVLPYSQSRTLGQIATLAVSRSGGDVECPDTATCELLTVGDTDVKRTMGNDTVRFAWTSGDWEYELDIRPGSVDLVIDMLRSLAPLREILELELGTALG